MRSAGQPDGRNGCSIGRRSFLALAGTSVLAHSSGCLGTLRGEPAAPKLGWVALKNYHHEAQRFDVTILRDGTAVHESTHVVEGKPEGRTSGRVLECTWGDEPGPYTLRGRRENGDWIEQPIAQAVADRETIEDTTDCVIAEGAYGRYGTHRFSWLVQDWCGEVPSYEGGCSFANADP